jgi:putative transposase
LFLYFLIPFIFAISLDPGIRTFLTGISEDEVIKIGNNMGEKIKKLLKRKDNIKENENIPKRKKKKNELRINRKISYLVEEMHWKTINYLTRKYKTILIGDMSVKSIISKSGVLSSMTKRIASAMSLYRFRERLKYKCVVRNHEYRMVNERYTSKCCSMTWVVRVFIIAVIAI